MQAPDRVPGYQRRWGHVLKLTSDQNTKGRFDNNRSGSVGGTVTGEGGDVIVVDYPHRVQEAESDTIRKTTIDWFDTAMSTRVNDPKTRAKVIVMQRCHQRDLGGHLLEQGNWEHLCLPAEYEGPTRATSIGFADPRQEHGEYCGPSGSARLKSNRSSAAWAATPQQASFSSDDLCNHRTATGEGEKV